MHGNRGTGRQFEFFVNFGTWGVIGGFLLYGALIGRIDLLIMDRLHQDDRRGFLLWFMLCMALLQPGNNLIEVITTAAGSVVNAYAFSYIYSYFADRRFGGRTVNVSPPSTLTLHRWRCASTVVFLLIGLLREISELGWPGWCQLPAEEAGAWTESF